MTTDNIPDDLREKADFIEAYRMAYLAANPGNVIPQLVYRKGWVEFRDPMLTRYRRKQIEAMTASLQYRARQAASS